MFKARKIVFFSFVACVFLFTSPPARSWTCFTSDRVSISEYLSWTDYVFWARTKSHEYQQGFWKIKAEVIEPLKGVPNDVNEIIYFRLADTFSHENPERIPDDFQIVNQFQDHSGGATFYTGLKEPEWAKEEIILFAGNIKDINYGKEPPMNILLFKSRSSIRQCPPWGFGENELQAYVSSIQYKYRDLIRAALLCVLAVGLFFGLHLYTSRKDKLVAGDAATTS